MPTMTITEFLVWLGSSAGATAFLSFVAERLPAFQDLSSTAKGYWMLGGSVAIALIAWAVLTYLPPEILAQLAPVFQIVYGAVASWIANQFAHQQDPANKSI